MKLKVPLKVSICPFYSNQIKVWNHYEITIWSSVILIWIKFSPTIKTLTTNRRSNFSDDRIDSRRFQFLTDLFYKTSMCSNRWGSSVINSGVSTNSGSQESSKRKDVQVERRYAFHLRRMQRATCLSALEAANIVVHLGLGQYTSAICRSAFVICMM